MKFKKKSSTLLYWICCNLRGIEQRHNGKGHSPGLFKTQDIVILCRSAQTTEQYLNMADVRPLFFSVLPLRLLSYSSLLWNLLFQPLRCETSVPLSLFLSFFPISSFLLNTCMHTYTHQDRIRSLMTDGKSSIVQHQPIKTQTHTNRMHTQTQKQTPLLCPPVPLCPVPCQMPWFPSYWEYTFVCECV